MEGLEKIIGHIEESARIAARETIDRAKSEAEAILQQADQEAELLCAEIQKQSEAEQIAIKTQIESLAVLQKRQMILAAKQEMIADIVAKAREFYKSLSVEEYFKIIISMVPRYALQKEGKIVFSKKDMERIPEQFEISLEQAIHGIEGAALKMGCEPANIQEGFVLQYGAIEINCAFDELIFAAKDNIQDKLHTLLFETQ